MALLSLRAIRSGKLLLNLCGTIRGAKVSLELHPLRIMADSNRSTNISINISARAEAREPEGEKSSTRTRAGETPGAKAKGRPKAVGRTQEQLAAAEVRRVARDPMASEVIDGPFPIAASGTGRRYYVFLDRHPGGPAVIGGAPLALGHLSGSWVGHGVAPRGFADLESALNAYHQAYPERGEVTIRWASAA